MGNVNATFDVKNEGGIAILAVTGQLDAHTAPEFDKQLNNILSSTKKIVLDFSNLEYIATASLGVIVDVFNSTQKGGGNIALCGLSSKIEKVFKTMSLDKLYTIKGSVSEAKAAL